jgi:hypothetical protein
MATARSRGVHHGTQSGEPSTIESNVAERIVMMCASALFTGLTPRECKEIASCAHARTFARDELLFMQGQPVRSMVLIQTGSVKLTQLSATGNEVILWMNGSGDAMGVHADSPSCSHTCSARAKKEHQPDSRQPPPGTGRAVSRNRNREGSQAPGARSDQATQASRQKDGGRDRSFPLARIAGPAHRDDSFHNQPDPLQMGRTGGCGAPPRSGPGA